MLMQSILKLIDGRTNDALNRSTEVPSENTSTAAKEYISLPPKEGITSGWSWELYFSMQCICIYLLQCPQHKPFNK